MKAIYEVRDSWETGNDQEFDTLEEALKHLQSVVDQKVSDGEDLESLTLQKVEELEFEIKVGVVLK